MKNIRWAAVALMVVSASFVLAQTPTSSVPITVDCSMGQSLNHTIAKLQKEFPTTVLIKGTCTEYVQVVGFDNLTLKGVGGATLSQPATGPGNLLSNVLLIEASRSVTVEGLTIQADTSTATAIGIGHGSTDIRLRNLNVQGGTEGIIVFEKSQV